MNHIFSYCQLGTIHRSQGATENEATLKINESMMPGQTYVGLSRVGRSNKMKIEYIGPHNTIFQRSILIHCCYSKWFCFSNLNENSYWNEISSIVKIGYRINVIPIKFSALARQIYMKWSGWGIYQFFLCYRRDATTKPKNY